MIVKATEIGLAVDPFLGLNVYILKTPIMSGLSLYLKGVKSL